MNGKQLHFKRRKNMKLTVLQILDLETGLFGLGEKELPIAISLKINQAITDLASVTHSIRETAQPILQLEQSQQNEKLKELYQEEMDICISRIELKGLGEINISATQLRQLAPILTEGDGENEH
jgi:hypothetical protein